MTLVTPASWYSQPCAVLSYSVLAGAVLPAEYGRRDSVSLLSLDYKSFHFGRTYSLLDHLLCWEASCYFLRALQKLFGEASVVRNWGLQPTAIWVSLLNILSSSPNQAFRWLQLQSIASQQSPERPWTRVTQVSQFQIPDSQKLWGNTRLLLGSTVENWEGCEILPYL